MWHASCWASAVGRAPNAQLHGFMVLSDRALADIAAMSGVIPIEHIARAHGDRRWTTPIQQLRHRPAEALAANDLSVAA